MPSTSAQQSITTDVSSKDTDHMLPISPWRFALVLLGLAAVLIVIGAAYPEFFSGSLSHFGTDTP